MFGSSPAPSLPALTRPLVLVPLSGTLLLGLALLSPVAIVAQEAPNTPGTVSRADEADLSFRVTTNTQARGFDVVLTEAPSAPVTIVITSDDPGAAVALVANLTFDADNWNQPQTVRIRSVIDADNEDEEVTFTLTNTNNGEVITRLVRINDSISGGLLVSPTGPQTLGAGEPVEYAVRLELAPTADVVVEATSSEPTIFAAQTLTFTTDNWDKEQFVTLSESSLDSFEGEIDEFTLNFAVNSDISAPEYRDLEAVRVIEIASALEEEEEEEVVDPVTPDPETEPPLIDPEVPAEPVEPEPEPETPDDEDETEDEDLETDDSSTPDEGGFGGAQPDEDIEDPNTPREELDDPEVTAPIGNQPDEIDEPGEPRGGFGGAAPEEETMEDTEETTPTATGGAGPTGLIRTGGAD